MSRAPSRRLTRLETQLQPGGIPLGLDERRLRPVDRAWWAAFVTRCFNADGTLDPDRFDALPPHEQDHAVTIIYRAADRDGRAWIRDWQPQFAGWLRATIGE